MRIIADRSCPERAPTCENARLEASNTTGCLNGTLVNDFGEPEVDLS
jgi:hypothetical protein